MEDNTKELNYYYCEHNDIIAERIGDILEEMGMFKFTPLVRRSMNLYGVLQSRLDDINTWYAKNVRSGGNVNIVIFLTKFIKGNLHIENELKMIRKMCKKKNVNIYTIVDDEVRKSVDYDSELYTWLYKRAVVYDVTNSCIIADTIDVARSMTMELVKQRFKCMVKKELPENIFDIGMLDKNTDNVYIKSIANAYEEIPDYDCPGKFLLVFSVFKYIEQSMGKSPYSKCMEYLLHRSVKNLLMTKKDLELSKACLISDMNKIIVRKKIQEK